MSTKRNKASMNADAAARLVAAFDQDETTAQAAADAMLEGGPTPSSPAQASASFDPGKIDGRTLRKTGREPFATRIKPETHEQLRRIAYHRGITIAEAVELAVAAF